MITTTLEVILLLVLVAGIIHVVSLLRKRVATARLLKETNEKNQLLSEKLPELYTENKNLSEINAYYKDLVETANDLIFRCDINGYFLYSNTKAFKVWGLNEKELIGKKYLEFIREDYRRQAEKFFFRQFISKELTSYFEYPAIGLNKQEIWLGQNTQLIFENGEPIGFQAVARDITVLKTTQIQLEESEQQYRNVVDILQEGIVILDKDGKIIAVNASAEKILGLSFDKMQGLTAFDPIWHIVYEDESVYLPDDLPPVISLRTGQPMSDIILGVYCSDNTLVWVSVNSQPIFRNAKAKPDGVVITFSDITKRKNAEQALLSSNANNKAWMDSSQDTIWSVDVNYNILACNIQFRELFEQFFDVKIDKGDNFVESMPPDTRGGFIEIYSRALSGEAFTIEYPATAKNGVITFFEITFNPIYEGEQIAGVASYGKDITERKKQQDEIRRSKANLDAWINSAKDAIWSTDINYNILACNNNFKELFNRYIGETITEGDNFLDKLNLSVEENIIALTGLYNRALSGEAFAIEYPAVSSGGELTFFEITFNPIYDGENVTGVAASAKDITERKNQQEEIRRSRANLDAWMDNTKDAIWSVDKELNLILMNKVCAEGFRNLTGYSLELGNSVFNLIHPDLADHWIQLYNRAFAGEVFTDEQSYNINDTVHYVDMSLNPIYEGDDIIGVAVLSRDMTQRKLTEQTLKETMLLQKAILDSSNYMIIATEIDGTISTFNPASEKAMGYSSEELVGKQTPGIFHLPDEVVERAALLSVELGFDVPVGFETFVAKAKIGQLYEDEWTYVRKDGTRFPIMLSISSLQNPDGEITGYLGIATDITAQKQMLAELERRDRLLEGTSHALQQLITASNFEEGLHDTLTIVGQAADADRVYLCRSYLTENNVPTMRLMAEWQKQFLNLRDVRYEEISYADIGLDRWYNMLSGGTIIQGVRSSFPEDERKILIEAGIYSLAVVPVILKEDLWGFLGVYDFHTERVWGEWERAALLSVASSLAGAIERYNTQENLKNQAHDLELKNLELNNARESAEVANRAKSSFLSNMSHELRTPLNAILGFAQILQKDKTLPEQSRNYISMMYRSGNHLLEMINDVLDISKIEAGHMELLPEEFDLHELLADMGEMFTLRCKEKKLDFNINTVNQDLRFVVADHKRLKQVLINLTSNAVKFTSVGSVSISLVETKRTVQKTGTESQEIATVRFSVTDTGRGIPPHQLQSIFQPFKQVSGMYSDGTGLGLAICDRIIRMMEGEITIQSTIGRGSVFSFEIPMRVSQAGMIVKAQIENPIIGILGDKKWKVLVVDDILTNCIVARGLLEPLGFVCAEADTGVTAIQQVKEFRPDIVLMDILMPDMCGDEAVKILRDMPEYENLPIIALTASGFDGRRDELISEGFSEYIRKPFLENELLTTIKRFIPVEYIRESAADNISETEELSVNELAQHIWNLPDTLRKELCEAIEFQDFEQIEQILTKFPDTPVYTRVNAVLQKAITLSNYKLLMAIINSLETYS